MYIYKYIVQNQTKFTFVLNLISFWFCPFLCEMFLLVQFQYTYRAMQRCQNTHVMNKQIVEEINNKT